MRLARKSRTRGNRFTAKAPPGPPRLPGLSPGPSPKGISRYGGVHACRGALSAETRGSSWRHGGSVRLFRSRRRGGTALIGPRPPNAHWHQPASTHREQEEGAMKKGNQVRGERFLNAFSRRDFLKGAAAVGV